MAGRLWKRGGFHAAGYSFGAKNAKRRRRGNGGFRAKVLSADPAVLPLPLYGQGIGAGSDAGDGRYGEAGCGNPGETGTEDRTDGIEDKVLIEEALGKLAEELREVVILHYFQELSLRETAAVLQAGLPLVKYRIGKAKEKLKEVLSCVP